MRCPRPLAAQDVDDGRDSLRAGKVSGSDHDSLKGPGQRQRNGSTAQRDLRRAYATIGKYDEAESAARRAHGREGRKRSSGTRWAKSLLIRGKRAAAESAFVRAGAEHAPDSLTAALNLAVLHFDRGERDRATKEFDKFIDVYNASGGANLTSDELVAVATRRRIPRRRRSAAVQGCAQGVRPRARSPIPSNADARVKLGELFLRKYNFADAQNDVRRSAAGESEQSARAARRRAALAGATDRPAATRCFAPR